MAPPLRHARLKLSQGQWFWHEQGIGGPTIVLLHGAWHTSQQWVPVMALLSPDYHCFAPDLLGFGESERPPIHYSIALLVEGLAEYLAALRLREVYLVADSLGAWVAARYALQHLDQVQGLVLLSPEGVAVPGQAPWRGAAWLMGRPPVLVWLLRACGPLLRLLGQKDRCDRLWQLYERYQHSPTACHLLFQRRRAEIQAEQLQAQLPWLKRPVLLLQEMPTTAVAEATLQVYARALPQAVVKQLPAGPHHHCLVDAPDRVAAQIRQFISQRHSSTSG
ncbi:alpha/beta fold hydrolase [Trichothermofontia sp.]